MKNNRAFVDFIRNEKLEECIRIQSGLYKKHNAEQIEEKRIETLKDALLGTLSSLHKSSAPASPAPGTGLLENCTPDGINTVKDDYALLLTQKKALLNLLPAFTNNSAAAVAIIQDLEDFYNAAQEKLLEKLRQHYRTERAKRIEREEK